MNEFAKTLILIGLIFVVLGGMFALFGKIPGIGKLPGDLYLKKGNVTFYFPWVTCLLLSLVLTFILNLFIRK